ncbi:hypothetical protein EDD21DRAFT_384215, partial [Dissophora ornata]
MSSDRRVAIITGSSCGIGRAVAIRLAQDGHNVSSAGKAQEVVDIIHNTTASKATAVQGDVRNLADGQNLIEESLKAFGRIDVVVFNAAWIVYQTIHDVTDKSYEEALRTNVKDPMFFTMKLIPYLKASSCLVYLSTTLSSASTVAPNYFLYCTTKGA